MPDKNVFDFGKKHEQTFTILQILISLLSLPEKFTYPFPLYPRIPLCVAAAGEVGRYFVDKGRMAGGTAEREDVRRF